MSPHTAYTPLEDELPAPPSARGERRLVAWGLAVAVLASAAAVLLPAGALSEPVSASASVEGAVPAREAATRDAVDAPRPKAGCRRALPAVAPEALGPDDL